MNKILITLIFSFVCMFANATSHNKLHIGYDKDMCNDYYVLSVKRANAVKKYLESRGVKVTDTTGHGMDDDFGRVAIVTVK